MKKSVLLLSLLVIIASISTGSANPSVTTLTLMTHDSFAISKSTIAAFEKKHGAKIRVLKSGDAGAALNQAILSKQNPMADIFFGVDTTFMSRALKADIFEPYEAPGLQSISDDLKLDSSNRLIPIDFGDVCLNYDIAWFKKNNIAPPKTLDDLTKPVYKNLTVIQNPATSSPGLAFLMTTVGLFGDPGYKLFWEKMRANDVYVSNGWTDAYYGQFSRAKGGTKPIVVSYASSPAAEVHYSETPLSASPTAAVLTPGTAFRQIEFVGILKGSKQSQLARRMVDFMLGPTFQKDIPLNMWVFPAAGGIDLPGIFLTHARKADQPVMLSPDVIESNYDKWIETWTDIVLR